MSHTQNIIRLLRALICEHHRHLTISPLRSERSYCRIISCLEWYRKQVACKAIKLSVADLRGYQKQLQAATDASCKVANYTTYAFSFMFARHTLLDIMMEV